MDNIFELGISTVLKTADKESSVLLEARSGRLYIGTSTNYHKVILESSYEGDDFRAIISSEIAREAQSMFFGSFTMHDDFIEFKNNSNKTKIALTKGNISIMDLARGYEKNNNAVFASSEIKNAFSYTRHASNDKNIGDIVLRGFHFTLGHESAEVMASNGAMLSLVKINQNNVDFKDSQILLLNPEFISLIKVFGDEGELKIGFNESSVSVTQFSEYFTLRAVSSLLSGKSPLPYEKVISSAREGIKLSYVVNKKSFLEAVRDVRVFSSDTKTTISIFNTGEFELTSTGMRGEASRQVEVASYKNPADKNIDIRINIEYLFNYLSSNRSELISVGVSDPLSPVVFEDSYGVELMAPLRN